MPEPTRTNASPQSQMRMRTTTTSSPFLQRTSSRAAAARAERSSTTPLRLRRTRTRWRTLRRTRTTRVPTTTRTTRCATKRLLLTTNSERYGTWTGGLALWFPREALSRALWGSISYMRSHGHRAMVLTMNSMKRSSLLLLILVSAVMPWLVLTGLATVIEC